MLARRKEKNSEPDNPQMRCSICNQRGLPCLTLPSPPKRVPYRGRVRLFCCLLFRTVLAEQPHLVLHHLPDLQWHTAFRHTSRGLMPEIVQPHIGHANRARGIFKLPRNLISIERSGHEPARGKHKWRIRVQRKGLLEEFARMRCQGDEILHFCIPTVLPRLLVPVPRS